MFDLYKDIKYNEQNLNEKVKRIKTQKQYDSNNNKNNNKKYI